MNREREVVVICPLGRPVKVKIPFYALLGKGDYENTHHCSEDRDDHNSPLCSNFNKCYSESFRIIMKKGEIKTKRY